MIFTERHDYIGTLSLRVGQWVKAISLPMLLVVATLYVFLNARNDWYGDLFLLVILFISLPCIVGGGAHRLKTGRYIFLFLMGYLGLALLSIFYPPSEYVNLKWLLKSFFRIVSVILVIQAVSDQDESVLKTMSWLLPLLCLLLAVTVILNVRGVFAKEALGFLTPWHVVETEGNSKIFCFYLLFLMWASVAFLWNRGLRKSILAIVLTIVTFVALFSSTSESAQFAGMAGIAVFLLSHVPVSKGRYWLYLLGFTIFLLLPLLWVFFTPIGPQDPVAVWRDTSSFLRNNWNIGSRLYLYDFCSALVQKEFLFGYGFGSTLSIPIPAGRLPGWESMPGGHPHNIVFLILIEHGIIGFLWLSSMVVLLFNYLYKATQDKKEGPVIWALAISGQIIFSLSFSIWHPDVVLTYGLFFVFLLIVKKLSTR